MFPGRSPRRQITGLVITALACKGLTAHWVSLNLPVNGDSLNAIARPMATRARSPLSSDRLSPLSSLEPEPPPPRA
jgi:hypothetical protein